MFLKVKECRRVLFQEILKAPYSSQAVNGVYMYPNTQCKNENQGQGVSYGYRYMRQSCTLDFSSYNKFQYLLEQHNSNLRECLCKSGPVDFA